MPQRRSLGFALALLTAVLWGVLPIALKLSLTELDAWTITWCRFAGAALTMGVWLWARGQLPSAQILRRGMNRWLILASVGITGNYVLYLLGLSYTSPAVTQTVMQVAPLMLVVLGMIFLRERFSRLQWIGLATLVAGLAVFFNRRLPELLSLSRGWSFGIVLLLFSSLSWAFYGLSQKQLQRQLTTGQILFFIYTIAALILFPAARLRSLDGITTPVLLALLFSVANTVVAYGAFATALEVWEVSRVSSVVASAPLFTFLGAALGVRASFSWVTAEALSGLSIFGALCVVAGSAISALGRGTVGKSRESR